MGIERLWLVSGLPNSHCSIRKDPRVAVGYGVDPCTVSTAFLGVQEVPLR